MPRPTPPPDSDQEEVVLCDTCGDREEDCCCYFCNDCEERYEEPNGCMHGHCERCESCCDCEECPSCSTIVYSGGERLDNCCYDCGECLDCCCCEDEEDNGNRCYSTDPLRVLHFSAVTDDFDAMRYRRCKPIKTLHKQRFGIEIEKTKHSHDDDYVMNSDVAERLSCHGLLDSRITGYSVACNDASLEGSSPAESKTPPLTFADHQMCHYGYMMLRSQDWSRDYWLEHMEYYKSLTPFKQFNLFRQQYFDGGMDFRWQRHAKAWSNDSCGMHVNVSDTMTSQATLYKVFLFIVKSHPNDIKHIGGRLPQEYCRSHHNQPVWSDVEDRYIDTCHLNYVQQVNVQSMNHPQAQCRKHDAMSRRSWRGWEMRLFRSSTNPMRILGNMQTAQLLCDYFQYVPYSDVEHTGLGPIVKHAVKHRRTFPYAHGNFARQSELAGMVRLFADHIRESRRKRK